MLLRQGVDTVKIHMRIIDRLQLVVQPLCLGKGFVGNDVLRAVFFRQICKHFALRAQGGDVIKLSDAAGSATSSTCGLVPSA